jgi:hypothetical protein
MSIDRVTVFLAFLSLAGAGWIAATGIESSSQSSRAQALDALFAGYQVMLGLQEAEASGVLWLGRLLVVVGLGLVAFLAWRRAKSKTA